MSGKVLYSKVPKMFELFEDILLHTPFWWWEASERDSKPAEIPSGNGLYVKWSFNGCKQSHVLFQPGQLVQRLVEGIAFYQFLCAILKDYDTRKTEIIHKLQTTGQKIFRKVYLMADMTVDHEGMQICTKPLVSLPASCTLRRWALSTVQSKPSAHARDTMKLLSHPVWYSIMPV